MAVLRRMADRHETIVVAMHDIPMALAFASRVVVLDAGRVVLDTPPGSVTTSDMGAFFG